MGCFDWPARRWFRILWVLVAIGLLASLPVLIIQASKHGWSVQDQMWFVAGLFTLLALPVSIYEVAMHLEYFTRPKLQIRVIRILWMVPIYAIDCFLSLTPQFHGQHDYFDAIRECYEAFVIYNFFMFLLAYLEDEYGDIDAYFSSKQDISHLWPVNYVCRQWHMGIDFFWQCKKGILNYVILQPLITFIRFVIYLCDKKTHHDDSRTQQCRCEMMTKLFMNNWNACRAAYPYLVTINMISASWALYCLVLMFKGTHNELKPIRPLSKFLIVKAVIFATFWQSVALALVTYLSPKVLGFDVLERLLPAVKPKEWGDGDRAAWLQSWLICLEMFLAALAHAYAFPPRDYIDPACQHVGNFAHNVKVMFDVRDVADDVEGVVYDTVQGRIDDIHQVGRAARNIVTRPSRLLGMLQRQSSKHVRLTDSEDPGSDTDDGSRRRQLLPVVGPASDSTSNNSQQRLANRREYQAPTEQGRQTP